MEQSVDQIQKAIQSEARRLFEAGEIDAFIGFESGTLPLTSRPNFITAEEFEANPSNTDTLIWDSFCTSNLATYLLRYYANEPNRRSKREKPYPRVGITVKGCDCRSVYTLVKERQVQRDSIKLIGVPCAGMVDVRKIREQCPDEIVSYSDSANGTISVTLQNGDAMDFDREEMLRRSCAECRFPAPENTDVTIKEATPRVAGDGGRSRIDAFEAKSSDEKWGYFSDELSKCIRCNACRQACPTCWCKECFADQTDLKWIGVGSDLTDAMIFQITRIYHQAGRCVECDACYSACPMGVDLRTYTNRISQDVYELFDYLPDFDTETSPPLATFSEADSNDFITDPENAHE